MYWIKLILQSSNLHWIEINKKLFIAVKGGCIIIYPYFVFRYIPNEWYEIQDNKK